GHQLERHLRLSRDAGENRLAEQGPAGQMPLAVAEVDRARHRQGRLGRAELPPGPVQGGTQVEIAGEQRLVERARRPVPQSRVERLFGAVEVLGDAQGIAELRPGTAAQVGGPGGTLRPHADLAGDGGGETGVLHGRGRVLPAERPTSYEESLVERRRVLPALHVGEGFGTSRG